MNLALPDILIIVFYFALILFIGFFLVSGKEKNKSDKEEYLLAGRKVTLPLFVATLVATWYGNILGIGEFVYTSGIVAWICFGLPYYIAAALFAYFIAKRIRNSSSMTIPEQIGKAYGNGASKISSLIILIITIPAAYMLMLGVMLKMFTGWSLEISIVLGAVVSMAYLYSGGLKADILTNSAQFVFMYLGFGALLVFSIMHYGSPLAMLEKLPAKHLTITGGNSWQYVASWYIIAFQTFVDPSFHQRCAAAKSPEIAQKGVIISIMFWMVFDFFTLAAGLYAKAYLSIQDPMMSFPELAGVVLPVFWKGIFVVALLATVMSTLDSYAFISAGTIGHDIIHPIFGKKINHNNSVKIGLVITAFLGILMAIALPSAVDLIYKTSSIAVPALIVPLVFSYSKRWGLNRFHAILIMLSSASVSGLWVLLSYMHTYRNWNIYPIFYQIEPMLPGIIISVLMGLLFVKKSKYQVVYDNS